MILIDYPVEYSMEVNEERFVQMHIITAKNNSFRIVDEKLSTKFVSEFSKPSRQFLFAVDVLRINYGYGHKADKTVGDGICKDFYCKK